MKEIVTNIVVFTLFYVVTIVLFRDKGCGKIIYFQDVISSHHRSFYFILHFGGKKCYKRNWQCPGLILIVEDFWRFILQGLHSHLKLLSWVRDLTLQNIILYRPDLREMR